MNRLDEPEREFTLPVGSLSSCLSQKDHEPDNPDMAHGPDEYQFNVTFNVTQASSGTNVPAGTQGFVATTPSFGFPQASPLIGQPYPQDYSSYDLCAGGHKAASEEVEYSDGVVIAFCERCGVRMEYPRVKGGISMLQIQTLLGVLMGLDEENMQTEGFDVSDIIGQYADVRDKIETEEFAVRQAKKLFELATKLMETKVKP